MDFADFLRFAANFGKGEGDPGYDAKYDLNDSGAVDFMDFIKFAGDFGKTL